MPSEVWKYFEKTDEGTHVVCSLCDQRLIYKSSTSSMAHHLKSGHSLLEEGVKRKDRRRSDADSEDDVTPIASSSRIERSSSSSSSLVRESESPPNQITPKTISNITQKGRTITQEKKERISQAIADMIGIDILPLSFVENKGFKKLMEVVEPAYKVPTRHTIEKRIEKRGEDIREKIERQLKEAGSVALSSDGWTSLAVESYYTITGHFINEDWDLKCATFSTCAMEEAHTGENIAEAIYGVVAGFGINEKVYGVVRDNASNMVSAHRILAESYDIKGDVPCSAHTLQLCVNTGLNTFNPLLQSASKLVSHFKHSTKATAALQLKQEQLKLPKHRLIQSCKTRWNSTYYMLDRLLAQKLAITAVLSDRAKVSRKDMMRLDISQSDWCKMEALVRCLRPLEVATTLLCSETKPMLSMVRPLMRSLVEQHLATTEDDCETTINFKETVAFEIEKRFLLSTSSQEEEEIQPSQLASLLDPRHKNLEFESTEAKRESIRKALKEELEVEREKSAPVEGEVSVADGIEQRSIPPYEDPLDFLFRGPAVLRDELDAYLAISPADIHTDPLAWWKTNAKRYPRLAKVAKKYLCIPATSTSAERVFSTAGNTITAKRSCLSAEHVDLLVSIHKNQCYM